MLGALTGGALNADPKAAEEEAIKRTLAADVEPWNLAAPWGQGEAEAWARLYADVDEISGVGDWLRGSDEIVASQRRNHDSAVMQRPTYDVPNKIEFLKPDVALVRRDSEMRRLAGSARNSAKAILGIVMAKRDRRWVTHGATHRDPFAAAKVDPTTQAGAGCSDVVFGLALGRGVRSPARALGRLSLARDDLLLHDRPRDRLLHG